MGKNRQTQKRKSVLYLPEIQFPHDDNNGEPYFLMGDDQSAVLKRASTRNKLEIFSVLYEYVEGEDDTQLSSIITHIDAIMSAHSTKKFEIDALVVLVNKRFHVRIVEHVSNKYRAYIENKQIFKTTTPRHSTFQLRPEGWHISFSKNKKIPSRATTL